MQLTTNLQANLHSPHSGINFFSVGRGNGMQQVHCCAGFHTGFLGGNLVRACLAHDFFFLLGHTVDPR